jgi:hypothetical protein
MRIVSRRSQTGPRRGAGRGLPRAVRTSGVFLLTMVLATLAAQPASAEAPDTEVWQYDDVWEFESHPCDHNSGPFSLKVTLTVRDIIFSEGEGGKTVSTFNLDLNGPDAWSGTGTQTLLQHNGIRTLSIQFVATNAATNQKIGYHAIARFPELGELDLEPPFGPRCIRSGN